MSVVSCASPGSHRSEIRVEKRHSELDKLLDISVTRKTCLFKVWSEDEVDVAG